MHLKQLRMLPTVAPEELEELLVHPSLEDCPDPECSLCAMRACPHGDFLHFHHDGCPSCYYLEEQCKQ